MKVVLFCGGLGMRMRDGVTTGPKPMAMIGDRLLLWMVWDAERSGLATVASGGLADGARPEPAVNSSAASRLAVLPVSMPSAG